MMYREDIGSDGRKKNGSRRVIHLKEAVNIQALADASS